MLCDDAHTKNWQNPVHDIKVIRAEWSKKNEAVWTEVWQWKGSPLYTQRRTKTFLNIEFLDIEFLKNQNPPGPFTWPKQVLDYLGCYHNDVIKNKSLYIEVRLAKKHVYQWNQVPQSSG